MGTSRGKYQRRTRPGWRHRTPPSMSAILCRLLCSDFQWLWFCRYKWKQAVRMFQVSCPSQRNTLSSNTITTIVQVQLRQRLVQLNLSRALVKAARSTLQHGRTILQDALVLGWAARNQSIPIFLTVNVHLVCRQTTMCRQRNSG